LKFFETEITGVFDILIEPHQDERGFFTRVYCPDEFAAAGIVFTSTQINLSRNRKALTLRGMHWQELPYAEAKFVRVISGVAYDVVVDLRIDSPTFQRWIARKLTAEAANGLYIPEGCAHGFLTLVPDTDILYQMSRPFVSGHAKGFRWDDPTIGIKWPARPQILAASDMGWPTLWKV
jgi:dTDP-4-dehydrorhamnose 3,5-epimerase